jgi:transposase
MQDTPTKRTRRWHAPELKDQVINACKQPGASVAGVALAHGLNANLVRRWLKPGPGKQGTLTACAEPAAFVAVPMPNTSPPSTEPIRLELRRGASSASLQWPASAATECGVWLCEWLR